MAKKRRRRVKKVVAKKPPPKPEQKVKKKEKKPHADHLLSLGMPNLMALPVLYEDKKDPDEIYPPDLTKAFTAEELNSSTPGSAFWKLLNLAMSRWNTQHLCIMVNDKRNPAFVDERYEMDSIPVGGLAPPTWMDAEIFLRTAVEDKEIQTLMDATAAANNTKQKTALEARLQVLFDTKYREYLAKQFPKVKGLLAKWLMARAVWMKEEPKKKSVKPAK